MRAAAWAQLTAMLRDGRFRALAAGVLLLTIVAMLGAYAQNERLSTERAAATRQDEQLWLGQGNVNPHSAAHFGRYVFKPVSPLAFLDPGLSSHLGSVARLEAHVQNAPRDRPSEGGTVLSRFPEVSAAFALQVLMPVLIILAGFTTFSGAQARTLLRQELAAGARAGDLALGRLMGFSAAIALLLLPVLLIAGVVSALDGPDAVIRAIWAGGGYALYLITWTGVVIGVSALCQSARTSLTVLLGVWVMTVFLAPRFANDLAERIHPTPSTPSFKAALREDLESGPSGHDGRDARLEAFKLATLSQYGVTRIEDLPVNWDGLALQEGERISAEVAARHYNTLWEIYDAQAHARLGFAVASPVMAIRPWSSAMAGTDVASHIHFAEAVERYRFDFVERLNLDIAEKSGADAWGYEADPSLLKSVETLDYNAPGAADAISRSWPALVVLGIWAAIAVLFARLAASRLRPA